ncbi:MULTISPECIES: hypothetical protein [Streptococcus]|uniref:hypothetical protein n=1 Tax=Streptococcus TaxID=1301 RepID=UPI0018A01E29|nr:MULTISPECIES: hypothetical protein [Streptococcus]MBF7050550.1 hypothetical protein [Streptococcus sp. HF-2466]
MKTVTLEEVIEAFEKQFYPLGELQKEKMLQHPNPQAVLGKLAFLIDCARC